MPTIGKLLNTMSGENRKKIDFAVHRRMRISGYYFNHNEIHKWYNNLFRQENSEPNRSCVN